ncbi:MAG TPA: hypothetical protein EYP68_08530 [Candidatus Korarchaeota archaeon]|nr:hypothetical protein [Candidatus Korarchaeota archaeon]
MRHFEELKLIAIKQLRKLIAGDLGSIHPKLLQYLQEEGAVQQNKLLSVKAAIALVKIGVSVERTAKLLDWKEFESLCEEILNSHGFFTIKHVRFSFNGKRYEIDLLGLSSGVLLSIDCKKWSRARRSSLLESALQQIERTEAFSQALPELRRFELAIGRTILIPMVVCWISGGVGIFQGVPIVPLHSLNSYLTEFDPLDREIARKEVPWEIKFSRIIQR